MKYLRYIVLLVIVFCVTGCGKGPDVVLIDSFEGELNNKTVDFGSSLDSTIKVEAEKTLKVDGEQSLKFSYELHPKGYMWVARGYNLDVKGAALWLVKPQKIRWDTYDALTLQMYGNNNARMIALDIKDAGGEIWRFLLIDDFQGWKEVTCPFTKFFVRTDWQPKTAEGNEILDFPIMSFQFEPRTPGKDTRYFDSVKVVRFGTDNSNQERE